MKLVGEKRKPHYTDFLKEYLPKNIKTYVEPFGGTFNMSTYLENRPDTLVYNDIHQYDFDIEADIKSHQDYKKVMAEFDSEQTVFYLDPPYYNKEHLYDLKKGDGVFHTELRNVLKGIKGEFFLSYQDCKFIRELYKDFNIIKYSGDTFFLRDELIITNCSRI